MRELDAETYKRIGSRIRDYRIKKSMSQSELAVRAYISLPHVSDIEHGKSKLRLSTFVYIAEALQVSTDALLRIDIPEVNNMYKSEFDELLSDCTPEEIESLIKIVSEIKSTMRSTKK